MMPEMTTPVAVSQLPFSLDFASGIVSLGSCFADEVGSRLRESDFHIELNPFGTLYNPASVAEALQRLIDDREIDEGDLVQHEGLYHSWHHHGSFSQTTPEATLAACNERLHQAHRALRDADLLMVTFGSAWVYEVKGERLEVKGDAMQDIDSNSHLSPFTSHLVVANCHKLPATMFVRRRMTVEEIVALWQPLLMRLAACNPNIKVLFSVSPIRHKADGAHGNQLSKATLLLALDELLTLNSKLLSLHYFPSYEIVLDELRDYRFYDSDMVHPSPLAVEVVWEYFQRAAMKPAVRQQAHVNMKQHKQEKHIPLH